MKKGFKNKIAMLLCLGICVTGFSGCTVGKKNSEGNVHLKWLMIGPGKQKDSDMVWDEFNKKLSEKLPGVSVEFDIIQPAEYAEKWQLMMAASENIDIAWNGYLVPWVEQIKKGAILDITDQLNEYAPDLLKEIPDYIWEVNSYEGRRYIVPNRQAATEMRRGLKTHKENSDIYLDKEQLQNVFFNSTTATQECYDELEKYLETLKKNGKLNKGASPNLLEFIRLKGYVGLVGTLAGTLIEDDELKAVNLAEVDSQLLMYDVARDWFEKGYIRADILGLQNRGGDEGKKDGYDLWMHQYYDWQAEADSKKYGFPIDVIDLDNYSVLGAQTSTASVIPRTCSDVETSVKLLDLVNTKKGAELYNLLVYGIEGNHYDVLENGKIETKGYVSQATSDNDYGLYKWVVGNTFNSHLTTTDIDNYYEVIEKIDSEAVIPSAAGFVFDSDPVKIEIAQCNAVITEYADLSTGAVSNHKAKVAERSEKLKKAGIDKIVEELQRQLDEWKKNNK